jgi:hypothetical protein
LIADVWAVFFVIVFFSIGSSKYALGARRMTKESSVLLRLGGTDLLDEIDQYDDLDQEGRLTSSYPN